MNWLFWEKLFLSSKQWFVGNCRMFYMYVCRWMWCIISCDDCVIEYGMNWSPLKYNLKYSITNALLFHPRMRFIPPQIPLLPLNLLLLQGFSTVPIENPHLVNVPLPALPNQACTSPPLLVPITKNPSTQKHPNLTHLLLTPSRQTSQRLSSHSWVSTLSDRSPGSSLLVRWNLLSNPRLRILRPPLMYLHHLGRLLFRPPAQISPPLHPQHPISILSWWRCTGPTQNLMWTRCGRCHRLEVRLARCDVLWDSCEYLIYH